jgi:hypothetical protein
LIKIHGLSVRKARPALGDFDITRIKAAPNEAGGAEGAFELFLNGNPFAVGRQVGEVPRDPLEVRESAV